MELVKTIPYEAKVAGKSANYGTDIEFAKLAGKRHALAGSYYNGLRIVDISKPSRARTVSVYDCPIRQGDVQVFKAADGSKRTLATYTADPARAPRSPSRLLRRRRGEGLLGHAGQRQRQAGHVHRRRDEPALAAARLVHRGPAGLAQPDRAPQRQVPLQLELGPDHLDEPAIEIIDITDPGQAAKHAASSR